MKKIALFLVLIIVTGVFSDCVHSSKRCRQNMRKIQKARKHNPNFKV
ncbi:MAG: hypothetical protein H7259_11015 [Cytophagales bacterium]|nr:hypothetical protein [Cytophaga sp.]